MYVFKALKKAFDRPESRNYVVYPICVREGNKKEEPYIIFEDMVKVYGYNLGVPQDEALHDEYKNKLKLAVKEIHNAGIVHMDIYPSNIFWKQQDGGISIKLIDWDAIQLIGYPFSYGIKERLNIHEDEIVDTHWDVNHVLLICENITDLAKVNQEKEPLDKKFNEIFFRIYLKDRKKIKVFLNIQGLDYFPLFKKKM